MTEIAASTETAPPESAAADRGRPSIRSRLAGEEGFTLIELVATAMILAVVSVPIAGVLVSGSVTARMARERTGADQLAASQIETIRTLPYSQVGTTGGNPPGVLEPSSATTLPSGEHVTIETAVSYVSDAVPTAYVTNADYKKVVLTVTRTSDGTQLSQKTTYVAAASAPPLAGTNWVQIERQVVDAVTTKPLAGATVHLTGGPGSADRTDTTDGSGTVRFPALDSSSAQSPPDYTLAATLAGYAVFPDDVPPRTPAQVPALPGLDSTATIRMYEPVSATVNVESSDGTPYTGGAIVSLDSSRCGVAALAIPAGQSSVTFTTCQTASGKTVPLVPNVLGQSPAFDTYGATAWTSGGLWGAATPARVPADYPTTLSQTLTVVLSSTAYATRQLMVTVHKGGSPDGNARVEVTGGPAGVSLFGTTDSNGVASFTVPVVPGASTYTVSANDMGATAGTATVSAPGSSGSSIAAAVTLT